MKLNSWESDIWRHAEFRKGELVKITDRAKTFYTDQSSDTGVVIDFWPSNVYEGSSYEVLLDGNVKVIESKHLTRA